MDATQMISDSILESDEEQHEEQNEDKKGQPLAKLHILKNEHIPETELPLFMGDNVLGRDPTTCTLALSAPSISKQHASICISVYRSRGRHSKMDMEALVWDLGSMNGTRKGRLKLTPNVRYALSDGDSLVLADIPCHFVRCATNLASSEGDLSTPVSRNSRIKAKLPEVSGGKAGNRSTGNKTYVNRETTADVSLTKTPVSTSCLSFEKTPAEPQGTLVPESDSESEDEKLGKRTRGRVALASDSDSHKSSPTCSTFLSPVNKVVPESEDESPITPSSSFKNRPFKDVSLNGKETEVDVGQQQLMQKQAFALTDEETPVIPVSDKNDEHVTEKLERKLHVAGIEDLPVCTPEVSTNLNSNFNMDSDTDMEEEEEELGSADHVTPNSTQANQPQNTEHSHMDSDTDVDDDEGALYNAPKTVPSSDDHVKQLHVISVIQPEGIAADSDTDVDDDPALSDAAGKAKPAGTAPSKPQKDFCLDSDTDVDEEAENECGQNKSSSKTNASPTRLDTNSVSPDSIHPAPHRPPLDSDTDDEARPTPALVFAPTEILPTADFNILPDSDTDDEAQPTPVLAFAPTEILPTADFDILPDSDTDVEADSPLVIPVAATTLSVYHGNMSEALQSDSNADTHVEESSVTPAGNVDSLADHGVDICTDVECKETDTQMPELHKEVTPEFLLPTLQNCSTPVQISGGEVENMDTQVFLSPCSLRRVAVPAVAVSSCSDSQEEDLVVAETQSFVLKTRDCQDNLAGDHIMEPVHGLEPSDEEKDEHSTTVDSNRRSFHLGLSDSSHLPRQTQALAMESTQAFVPLDRNLNLQDTQAYATVSTGDAATAENAAHMEATQAYGVNEEHATVMSTKDQVHFALEATQAYISETGSDSENETNETNSGEETQPFDYLTSSALAIAETQPVSGFEEEESLASETEEREKHEEVAQPQEQFSSKAVCIAATQPMHTCDDEVPESPTISELSANEIPLHTEEDEESDKEDSIPVSRKRKAKSLQLEETQPLCSPGGPPTGAQPAVAVENRESDDEDLIPGPRKRKAKVLHFEEDQTLTNSELSVVETKPVYFGLPETQCMVTSGNEESDDAESEKEKTPVFTNTEVSVVGTQPIKVVEDAESDEEDSGPVSRKRRAKPQQLEETQTISSSEVSTLETQPIETVECVESDEEDSGPVSRKRRAKPQPLVKTQPMVTGGNGESDAESEEEKTPLFINTQVSVVETQPIKTVEDAESDEEDSGPVSRKRRAKPQQLEETQTISSSEVSTLETQPIETVECVESDEEDSGPVSRKRRAKPRQLEETQTTLETQPIGACEDEESIKEDSVSGPTKPHRLEDEQTQCLTNSEIQATVKGEDKESGNTSVGHPEPGASAASVRSNSGTGAKLKEEEQRANCSDPSKSKTRGKNKSLRHSRRAQSRLDEVESEKEEVEQPKKARGRKSVSQQKDKKERQTEINQQMGSISLIKAKQEGSHAGKDEKDNGVTGEIGREQQEAEGQREERKEQDKQAGFQDTTAEMVKPEEEKEEEEENEICGRTQMENKHLERQKREDEEKLMEHKEGEERNETEKVESERKDQEEKREEGLQRKEQGYQARLETEDRRTPEKVRDADEKPMEEQQEPKDGENMLKVPTRGRRAARRTSKVQPKQDSTVSTNDDVPARRTRSRSNSSNSVSSERSASSVNSQEVRGRGRGRGRGGRRISEPPQAATARSSNRRRTVAAETGSDEVSPQGCHPRSNSSSSPNSEISNLGEISQSRGRGGRQRGKGRKTEPDFTPPVSSPSDRNPAPKTVARGRKSKAAEASTSGVVQDHKVKAESVQAATTRGQQQAGAHGSEPVAADDEQGQSNQEGCDAAEESFLAKRKVRGRGQKAAQTENVETPAVSEADEAKHKRMGRKSEMLGHTEDGLSSSSNLCRGKEKAQTTDAEEGKENPVQAKRRGRASNAQAKKNTKESPSEGKVKEESEELQIAGKRERGRPSAAQKKKKEQPEDGSGASVSSMSLDANTVAPQPRTPTRRKRQIRVDSGPVAKTPRAASASPAASGGLQRQSYKVLFTGVMDEAGGKVLTRLGGSMAKGVSDMNCLVTDKVRRTVKFLCALARGIPIVTTHWLEQSGKAGSLLPPKDFIVKDPEQEKKFSFSLQESLRTASSQPLLQGYEIHVTKSVKPEPPQMKDIISCSGATFLPKMPSSHKGTTIVISCEEDWRLCGPAVSASLPVVTAEFILTGILQQRVDFQTHTLSPPAATDLQPAGGKERGRKKR